MDPAAEQAEWDVDRGEEEDQEDRELHQRPALDRAHPHRHPGGPHRRRDVDQHREGVEADDVDAAAVDVHPGDEGDDGQHRPGDQGADEGGDRVAGDDPVAVGGGEQVALGESGLEVAGDPEAGEDSAEGRRLQQHEDELEGGVAGREVEARDVADRREAPGEGEEEEEREDQRRDEEGRVGEEVVDAAPGDRQGDRPQAGSAGRAHVRTSLVFRAALARYIPIARTARAIPKPSASSPISQPSISSERKACSR